MLKRLGISALKRITPLKHQALIEYVERARRKRENKKKRAKLLALLGKTEEEVKSSGPKGNTDAADSDSDDEMDSGDDEADAEEHFSDEEDDDSDDDASSEDEEQKGSDVLMTDGLDIPRVDNIPVVSKLAKEKKLEQQSKQYKLTATRDKVKTLMSADAEEFESHFVENPFIKMRER